MEDPNWLLVKLLLSAPCLWPNTRPFSKITRQMGCKRFAWLWTPSRTCPTITLVRLGPPKTTLPKKTSNLSIIKTTVSLIWRSTPPQWPRPSKEWLVSKISVRNNASLISLWVFPAQKFWSSHLTVQIVNRRLTWDKTTSMMQTTTHLVLRTFPKVAMYMRQLIVKLHSAWTTSQMKPRCCVRRTLSPSELSTKSTSILGTMVCLQPLGQSAWAHNLLSGDCTKECAPNLI